MVLMLAEGVQLCAQDTKAKRNCQLDS
jgi:hypothetical protein